MAAIAKYPKASWRSGLAKTSIATLACAYIVSHAMRLVGGHAAPSSPNDVGYCCRRNRFSLPGHSAAKTGCGGDGELGHSVDWLLTGEEKK
jgi:hypothetical protein